MAAAQRLERQHPLLVRRRAGRRRHLQRQERDGKETTTGFGAPGARLWR